jgi:hypothetical protein
MGIFAFLSVGEAKHSAVRFGVSAGFCKVVEGAFCRLDNVARNERSAFLCPSFTVLDATLPFKDSPTVEVVLGELGEDRAKVNLTVTRRSKPAGA